MIKNDIFAVLILGKMDISTVKALYFSATNTTQTIVRMVAKQIRADFKEINITSKPINNILFDPEELLVVGMPVYSGRIPQIVLGSLAKLQGNGAPAIVISVYGNRDYDDALLELKNIIEKQGFKVVSAAAVIAQHSIMPEVGAMRPDNKDKELIAKFALDSIDAVRNIADINVVPPIHVKGNYPYKEAKGVPLHPKGDNRCNNCNSCVNQCPVGAISADNPRNNDNSKCISCGRCIVVCPQKSRGYKGLIYRIAQWKFTKDNSSRKEPEFFFLKR